MICGLILIPYWYTVFAVTLALAPQYKGMGELIILDNIDKLNTDKLIIISVLVQSEVIHTSWCYIHYYTELSSYFGYYYCRIYIYLSYYNLCTNDF